MDSNKYHNCGQILVISIVNSFSILVTKSHEPLNAAESGHIQGGPNLVTALRVGFRDQLGFISHALKPPTLRPSRLCVCNIL